ncbi:glycosyltransferase family 4 protein [Candidatus Parcubacteria bacterium]|nr:glycosyltransferase family 4 protein [Candidatus Parcubacteria bacterium]
MNKAKKILIATGIYPPDIGGPATYVKTLQEELPRNGFEVKIVTYGDNEEVKDIYKISRKRNVVFRYFRYFCQVWKLRKWADVIYIQGPVSEGLPATMACKLAGKDYLLKVVGDYAWEQGRQRFGVEDLLDDFQKIRYNYKVELFRKIQKCVVKSAKLVITPSEYLKSIVVGWGAKEEKVKVIYNSVNVVDFNLSKKEVKEELNLEGDIILTSGRLVPWKGFELLIELMPDLLEENPNFKLLIVGNGPDKEKLESKIDDLNLNNEVFILTSKKQPDVLKYMKASEMFVLNTGYEGLSHVIIEAFFVGIPVVTTKVGGNSELISNNKNGILVEYNNKVKIKNNIIDLWKNKEKSYNLVTRAKESLNEFHRGVMINSIVEILKK